MSAWRTFVRRVLGSIVVIGLSSVLVFPGGCSLLNEKREPVAGGGGGPSLAISDTEKVYGSPEPGEFLEYHIWLQNTGGETAIDVAAMIDDQWVFYPDIPPGEEMKEEVNGPFGLYIPSSASPGDVLDYTLTIKDGDDRQWQDTFSIEVQ